MIMFMFMFDHAHDLLHTNKGRIDIMMAMCAHILSAKGDPAVVHVMESF